MTTSTSKARPIDGQCSSCQGPTEPMQIPSIFGVDAHWIPAPKLCTPCVEKQEESERLQKAQDAIAVAFKTSRITPRFRERTFEGFQVLPWNRLAHQAAWEFDPAAGNGLLLHGSYGIGKTHLAAAIANKFLGKVGMLYISCPEFLLEIRESINHRGSPERLSTARQVPLLILDDIGAEKPSEWVRETLFVLVNHRYEYRLPTVFTTNCSLEELEARLGGRIVSRIAEMCRCIKFEGKDFRMNRNLREKENGSYPAHA